MSRSKSIVAFSMATLLVIACHYRGPTHVTKEFLRLDLEGARTSSTTWSKISHLMEPGDYPGSDIAVLVRSATVLDVKVEGSEALVRVHYDVAGIFAGDRCYSVGSRLYDGPDGVVPSSQEHTIRLRKIDGRWLIAPPPLVGIHVSLDFANEIEGCVRQLGLNDRGHR